MRVFPFIALTCLFNTLSADTTREEISLNGEVLAGEELALNPIGERGSFLRGTTERIAALEEEMRDVFTGVVRGDFGAKAASARPQIDSNRVFISGDLLYWTSFEGFTDFASIDNILNAPTQSIGSVERFDFNWQWGFRAAAGYRFPHDDWDFSAEYTWFYDKATRNVSAPGGQIFPLLFPVPDSTCRSAEGSWKFHYNNLDLTFAKSYFLSRPFSVKPLFGFKTAWINQSIKTQFNDPASFNVKSSMRNNFWGIGPLGGLNTNWFIGSHFHFISAFLGSLMAGDINVRSIVTNTTANTPLLNLTSNVNRVIPFLQGLLGIAWETRFHQNRCNVLFELFYEAQYWWRVNQLYSYGVRPVDGAEAELIKRASEDLGIHGVTFNAQFDF